MDIVALLSVAASIAAALGVAVATVKTYQRARAEHSYIDILRSSKRLDSIRALHSEMMRDGQLSDEELSQLVAELELLARRMARQERVFILEALQQNSAKGRERYIDKLLAA